MKPNIYLEFEEARDFVRSLNLKTNVDWLIYRKNKPNNIPSKPERIYKEKWLGIGDWLGTFNIAPQNMIYLDFEEAKKIVHTLNIKNITDWNIYCKNNKTNLKIPTTPNKVYENKGWVSWSDWLGTNIVSTKTKNINYLEFEEAKEIVQKIGLKTTEDWYNYIKNNNLPNIPKYPNETYENKGWVSMPDWLGYEKNKNRKNKRKKYINYEEAKKFLDKKFKSGAEYYTYTKSVDFPIFLPKDPRSYYNLDSIYDLLGLEKKQSVYCTYEEAKKYLSENLIQKSQNGFNDFCKNGNKPEFIPSTPTKIYKNEWKGWADFTGSGFIKKKDCLDFENARKFVHTLNLKNTDDWLLYHNINRIKNIPKYPQNSYKEFVSMPDWLGTKIGFIKWDKHIILEYLTSMRDILPTMDYIELYTFLGKNNLSKSLKGMGVYNDILSTQPHTKERVDLLSNIINKIDNKTDNEIENLEENIENEAEELKDILKIIKEAESTDVCKSELVPYDPMVDLHMYDIDMLTRSLDVETIDFLIKNRLKKVWNDVLNNKISVDVFKKEEGGINFNIIKNTFFDEYEQVVNIGIPTDYIFKEPNLMQKLVAHRLIKEKRYGNWSGTGAGKTLSAILAGRIAGVKNTIIICNNATVKGWVESINQYFKNNKIFTKCDLEDVPTDLYTNIGKYIKFNNDDNNYFVLNYETFQQIDGENIIYDLIENNRIDYIILDEIQNVKQRDEILESNRRRIINKLITNVNKQNDNVLVLAMSATPIINNLTEPKKLIELLTSKEHADLDTIDNINNGINMYKTLTLHGLRYIPIYNISVNTEVIKIKGDDLVEAILKVSKKSILDMERVLIETKLDNIKNFVKKGTLIYTHYVGEQILPIIGKFIENLGFKVGYYTGDDKSGLNAFKNGKIDVLIGSAPIGTGVDGIQNVCDIIIPLVLPWTSSEYQQLIGRVIRQGSHFKKVNIYIPQIKIDLENGNEWSWDKKRFDVIEYKKTLTDLVIDGIIPNGVLTSNFKEKLLSEAQKELENWIDRLQNGTDNLTTERKDLFEAITPTEIEYRQKKYGDFSELTKKWSISNSKNTHDRLLNNPSEWEEYHRLYREHRKNWTYIPYLEISKKIKREYLVVGDFGCGENLLSKEIPKNKVYAFDHIAIDENVTVCDISNVPLDDEILDVAVFSLSLMGSNYIEYLKEAYRVLKYNGSLYIAEPVGKRDIKQLEEFMSNISNIGFYNISKENNNIFLYLEFLKR